MAKKRKKKSPVRKVGDKANAAFTYMKQIFVTACVVIVCFVGIWGVYNYINPFDKSHDEKEEVGNQRKNDLPEIDSDFVNPEEEANAEQEQQTASDPKTVDFKIPEEMELSQLHNGQPEEMIHREGYTLSYNSTYKIANWVAYKLTASEATSDETERSDKFFRDPDVSISAENGDYSRSGYDKGHMAPAADMKWSSKAMRECFYLSNICPQKPDLNRGIWKDLEEQCREWAAEKRSLWIVTGPVINSDLKRLGKNRVGIPTEFYKVIVYSNGNSMEGIGFLFNNQGYKDRSLKKYPVSIDKVEEVTGIDFFYKLPDAVEKKIESKYNLSKWNFDRKNE